MRCTRVGCENKDAQNNGDGAERHPGLKEPPVLRGPCLLSAPSASKRIKAAGGCRSPDSARRSIIMANIEVGL